MIDPRAGSSAVVELIFTPVEGPLPKVEEPDIILHSVAGVTSEDNEVRFVKDHAVTVTLPWCVILGADINNLPGGLPPQVQQIQLIFEQSLRTRGGSSVDNHLHLSDHGSCVGGSLSGYEAAGEG